MNKWTCHLTPKLEHLPTTCMYILPLLYCISLCVRECVYYSVKSESLQLMDCSLPNSSVHGILQARILEWAANPFSRESSQPRDGTRTLHWRQILYHLNHQESPSIHFCLNQKEITILKFVFYHSFGLFTVFFHRISDCLLYRCIFSVTWNLFHFSWAHQFSTLIKTIVSLDLYLFYSFVLFFLEFLNVLFGLCLLPLSHNKVFPNS